MSRQSSSATSADDARAKSTGDVEKSAPPEAVKPVQAPQDHGHGPPPGANQTFTPKTILLLVIVFVCMFLVGLDRTIVSTAIPAISDEFKSFDDVGWYGSVYLMTCCAFQLLFGKIYAHYSIKWTFILSILLFEIASAIQGAAPNSVAFIIGRAICGIGAAGIFSGTIMCIVYAVPLHKRPAVQGLFGAVGGLSTITGPLIGGAFTSRVTWRWCFYINLPFGALAMAAIFFLLEVPDRPTTKIPWQQKLKNLDAPGTGLLVPCVTCLLLALQWGGQTYAWSNGRVIALMVVFGVLFLGFIAVQTWLPKTATIPPMILKQRSVAAALWTTFCVGSAQYIFIYYIPIWYQSIKQVSAVSSGIRLLPLMIAFAVASIASGFLNQKVGYYTPIGIAGAAVMAIGAGLLTTWQINTGEGKLIGYQILVGAGMGVVFQTPSLATQTVLPKPQVPMGMALMFFGQLLGAAVFVSVGENVLVNQIVSRLSGTPGFNRDLVVNGGATQLLEAVPANIRPQVLVAYNESLRRVFQIALILSCLACLGPMAMEWKNILKKGAGAPAGAGSGPTGPKEEPKPASSGATADLEKQAGSGEPKKEEV